VLGRVSGWDEVMHRAGTRQCIVLGRVSRYDKGTLGHNREQPVEGAQARPERAVGARRYHGGSTVGGGYLEADPVVESDASRRCVIPGNGVVLYSSVVLTIAEVCIQSMLTAVITCWGGCVCHGVVLRRGMYRAGTSIVL
jgi:hypothetical protein